MKIFTFGFFIALSSLSFSQTTETIIPRQAVSVVSVNNVSLLQKISLDDLVKYEFMEEVQQELFDGSTAGKTLKDSGIDFDQKLNIFYGKGAEFELSGFTFGIDNRAQLFDVFDDFHKAESAYADVDFYESYFNRIAIKGNLGILFRVSPNMELVNTVTDSIWYARGNEYPWHWEESLEEMFQEVEEAAEGEEEAVEFHEDMEIEENTVTPIEKVELPVADEDPTTKTYFELRDSVEMSLQHEHLKKVCDELFVKGVSLYSESESFKEQMNSTSEGTFYFDNSRAVRNSNQFTYLRTLYPNFYRQIEELYYGNTMLGDLIIDDQAIKLKLNANYSDRLGSIYQKMTKAKFDKNVFKYIHKDNSAFFTYRINMREAYEQMFEVVHPLLEAEAETSRSFSSSLLLLEMWDELVNKDALFETYPGSMFGTYSGVQKVKTTKFVFEYDEETFEYTEKEVEAEEDMPLFTLGFTTRDTDIPEKILKHVARTEKRCHKENNYWVFEKAVLNSAPLYIMIENGLFIVSNDAHLVKENSNGYGSNSISKQFSKKAKKSGFVYAYADLGKAIEDVPREIFNDEENEMVDVIRGKSGRIELKSSKTNPNNTEFNLVYNFEGEYTNSGTYILDLINSLYVISK